MLKKFTRTVITVLFWFGLTTSIYHVGCIAYDGIVHDRSGAVSYVIKIDGIFEAWGQTYRGHVGTWLAALQVIWVFMSVLLAHLPRPTALRRIGLVGILAWALLWYINAVVAIMLAPTESLVWIHLAFVVPPAVCSIFYCRQRW